MAIYKDFPTDLGNMPADDEKAIKQSLRNILLYPKESRKFRRDFYSELEYLLFEPISEDIAEIIAMKVENVIHKWDDRVILKHLEVNPEYPSGYKIYLVIEVKGIGEMEDTIFLTRG